MQLFPSEWLRSFSAPEISKQAENFPELLLARCAILSTALR
jgi:hypothetical protein